MTSLKERIGAVSPAWLVRAYRAAAAGREFFRDYTQYVTSSSWYDQPNERRGWRDSAESYQSRLTINYHGLEKGSTFPSPKRPYGASKIIAIEKLLNNADQQSINVSARSHAMSAVDATIAFNETGVISHQISPSVTSAPPIWNGAAFRAFTAARHSIRNFDAERPVDDIIIREAVTTATEGTPSVCNRRSYRAHYYSDRKSIDALLDLQNGNRGFGHTVQGLFVVTQRRSSFVGPGERNQRWIDGGLFAMTLVFSLHSLGLGTCFLNWSQTNARTDSLRERGRIPRDEDIIVLIAVGYPPASYRVASSPARPLSETYVQH